MTPTWPLASIFFSSAEDFFKLKREDIIFNDKINTFENSRLKIHLHFRYGHGLHSFHPSPA